ALDSRLPAPARLPPWRWGSSSPCLQRVRNGRSTRKPALETKGSENGRGPAVNRASFAFPHPSLRYPWLEKHCRGLLRTGPLDIGLLRRCPQEGAGGAGRFGRWLVQETRRATRGSKA